VNALSSHGIRWRDIAAQPVGKRPAAGRGGGRINGIAPATKAAANAASSRAAGAPAPLSGSPQSRRTNAPARAITRLNPAENFAARGRAVTIASPEALVLLCSASAVARAVKLYGVCSGGSRVGCDKAFCGLAWSASGRFGQILKTPILRLSFAAV